MTTKLAVVIQVLDFYLWIAI